MPKVVNYEILKSCQKNTLFFINDITDILLIKVSDSESTFFSYTPFFNLKNDMFLEEKLSEVLRIKFNDFMNSKNYIILEKEDLNELSELFNHLNEHFGKNNSYTLH